MSFPNLSALAVRERAVTLFLLLLALGAGVYAFLDLGRAEDPAFTVRAMIVTVHWPGATPDELQAQVVDRLEKRIQEVSDLYRIDTTILQGQAHIQVEFEDYTSKEQVLALQYQVRKRMDEEAASLPPGVIGPSVDDDFGDVYFSLMALSAPGMPLRELSREAESLRDLLQRLPGVHKAQILGERQERVFVEFDTARLGNLGLTPEAVFAAIDANNRLLPAGRLETRGPSLYLRLDADLADPDSLAAVPLEIGGRLLRLADIATVRRGYEDPPSYLVRSQGQDALLLGVVMAGGANGLELGKQLAGFLARERQTLPLGMTLDILTNQADVVASAVDLFQIKFLIAVLVVVAVSVLAIGWRAGLVVGIAVPLTLCIAFVVMLVMGINLDRITLGALIIALGLLVDDAIIAVEMMLVKMQAGYPRAQAAAHAWSVTAAPMLFGTLITVAGFLPIGFAHSSVGEYAGNLFWVLLIALLASWLVAVIFVPYLGVKLLPEARHGRGHDQAYQTPLYRRLRGVIDGCVRRRKRVVFGTLGLLALSVVAMALLVQKQFFPVSDRPEVMISVYLPHGSGVAETDSVVRRLEALLAPLDEVRSYSAYTGAGAPRFFITANPEMPNSAFARIIAIAHDEQARDRVMARIRQAVADGEFPEARIRVVGLQYGPPVTWPVEFRLVGPEPKVLRDFGERIRDVMRAHPNMVDPHLEWHERVPVLHLAMDNERLRLLGLTPQAVSQALQFQLDGLTVTRLRQDIRTVDVVARLQRSPDRFDADRLAALEITTADNRKLPLGQLGQFEVRFEEPMVRRFMRQRSLTLQGDVSGAQANDVSAELWAQLAPLRAQLPAGYELQVAGTVESSQRANGSIEKLQPLMVASMLILIMLQMRSFSGTFMVAVTAPLGLIGATLALLLFHQPFGFVALLGLTGLAGIVMRNTLILTQQVSDNFEAGMDARTAVVEAGVQRARPVVLTALAAVLAFIPLTHDTYWGPLAYVLIGGVAVGTLITLLLVPALYALWFRIKVPDVQAPPAI
ncbi:Nickel and cobalt resistance protein CnrA [compost metagenome]